MLRAQISFAPKFQFVRNYKIGDFGYLSILLHFHACLIILFYYILIDSGLCKGRPKVLYSNPCEEGAPLTNELTGTPIICAVNDSKESICPALYECTRVKGIAYSVCCPETQKQSNFENIF